MYDLESFQVTNTSAVQVMILSDDFYVERSISLR